MNPMLADGFSFRVVARMEDAGTSANAAWPWASCEAMSSSEADT